MTSSSSIVDLVLSGAERVDNSKVAVWSDQGSLKYKDLVEGARGIAATMIASGIGRGDRVGVWMEKKPACVEVLIGIMWAGATYVPLDPRAPWRRCRSILLDCGLSALIIDEHRIQYLSDLLEGYQLRLALLDCEERADMGEIPGWTPRTRYEFLSRALTTSGHVGTMPRADDLAYILYTSGSTGTPKGVAHTHRSGVAFARWIQQTFGVESADVFASHAPFHFDLSISDLYASLGSGGSVRLISPTEGMLAPYLVRKVGDWGITIWYSTPSILSTMLETGGLEDKGLGGVRLILFAGEVFPTPQLRRLRRALPDVGLYNLFGPTETNVCTYYQVPRDLPDGDDTPIPIGRGCEHLETFVLDDDNRDLGVGVEGMLWVKGDNLMTEYWNNPERTEQVLFSDPRGGTGIACCTGDRVRLRADGNYEYLGRLDHMIKTRGYRVELGEVESVLTCHPGVLDAVAVALPDPKIANRIVATVVLRSRHSVDPKALRSFCGEYVPSYMIPEEVEIRDSLPRTSTGKADRQTIYSHWERKDQNEH